MSGGVLQFQREPPLEDFLTNAAVQSDGAFTISTVRSTDSTGERRGGAPAGAYRVTYIPNLADQVTAGHKEPVTLPSKVTVEAKDNVLKLELPAR